MRLEIIDGVCSFCEAVYVDGIRMPGKKAPLPFSDESAVTG
jgi:hypothetical protein